MSVVVERHISFSLAIKVSHPVICCCLQDEQQPQMADDRSLVVKAVPAVFLTIACLTVILRCYVRISIVKAFGVDDGAMVLSMVGRLLKFEVSRN